MKTSGRPSAKEWFEHLNAILSNKQLERCTRFPNDFRHIRLSGMACPQCQLDILRGFNGVVAKPHTSSVSKNPGLFTGTSNKNKQTKTSSISWSSAIILCVFFGFPALMIMFYGSSKKEPEHIVSSSVADTQFPRYTDSNLNNLDPVYPLEALRQGLEGTVAVYIEVLPNGESGQVEVAQTSGHRILDEAAVATIKKWRFVPGTIRGRATTQWVQIPITFRIQNPAFKPQVLKPRQSTVIQSTSPPQNQQYNSLVIGIQKNLIRLGFEPGPVDGQIGQKTQRAIEAFQRSRGLPIDGKVNQDLERALESSQPIDTVKSNKLIAVKPIGRVVQVYPELNYFEFDFEGATQIRVGDSVIIKSASVTARVSKISGLRGSALILSGNPNSIGNYAIVNKIN